MNGRTARLPTRLGRRARTGLALAAALVAGCASDGGLKPQAAPIDPASLRIGPDAAPGAEWPADRWWRRFGDPQLDRLVVEAVAGSPGIAAAEARVRRALHLAQSVGAAGEPSVALNASAERQRLTEHGMIPPAYAGSTVTTARLAIDLRYDFDFWERNRALLQASLGEARAAAADADAARLVLQSAVAAAYFSLQRTLEEAALARERIARLAEIEQLARQRHALGIDSEIAVANAAGVHSAARLGLVSLAHDDELLRNQIGALLGAGPQAARDLAAASLRVPDGIGLPARLPADLIGRRADVAAQRARVEAAAAAIGAARAQFFPNFDLLAFAGLQSVGLSRLIDAGSGVLSVGPALHLPLFNQGSLRAGLGARNAEFDIAVSQYNATVVAALREAGDAAARTRAAAHALAEQQSAIDAAQRSHELALSRQRAGLANRLPALVAETALIEQRERQARLREQQLSAALAMIRALGGGYGS